MGLVLLAIGLVHRYFLRPGHPWGDDFAQYLMHARNLAEGRPYSQTGYIYNPDYPALGPPAYPPGTPLLLAPIWRLWGLNWTAMKWTMIGCLLVWLALLAWYFQGQLPVGGRALLVVLVGLNHFFLDQTNAIGSDLPFLVWVYLTLVLVQAADQRRQTCQPVGPAHRKAFPSPGQAKGEPLPAQRVVRSASSKGGTLQPSEENSPLPSMGETGEQSWPGEGAIIEGTRPKAEDRGNESDAFIPCREPPPPYPLPPWGEGRDQGPLPSAKVSPKGVASVGWHLAVVLAAWAALATRTIGLVLWMAILLADWLRYRRFRPPLIWATGVFLLLAGLLFLLIPGTTGYLDQVAVDPALWARHAWQYGRQLAAFWSNPFSKPLAAVLAAAVTISAVVGYLRQCRQQVSAREVFVLLYGAAVVLWPSYQGFRMLNPIVPLWLFYAWQGLEELGQQWNRLRLAFGIDVARAITLGLATAIGVCYASALVSRPTGPLSEGIGRLSSQELFQAVQKYTHPEDVLVFIKPRALALLTGRRCSVYHPVQTDEELWTYFEKIQARFLVMVRRLEAMQGAEKLELVQWLADFAARNPHRLQPIWANDDFALYRIQNRRY